MKKEDNKIYVDMNGRTGNQLFQYAFARKLSLITNKELVFDFKNVIDKGVDLKSEDTFIDNLKDFNVIPYESIIESGYEMKIHGSKKQKRLLKRYFFLRKVSPHLAKLNLLQRHQYKMQSNGLYKEDECNIRFYDKYNSNIFIKGYFEDPQYFDDIRDILLKEFTPKYPEKDKNKELYNIIKNNESVCVSCRTWKEIKDNKELYKDRNVCTKEYYDKAIELIHNKYPNAVFIIFSDDIDFIKKNYKFKYKTYFEDGTDEVWEKLRLMYNCKHFIMSTSTFPWWAQYLSRNNNKTVISPGKWYAGGRESKLLLDSWIKVN